MAEHILKTDRLTGRPIGANDFSRLRAIHSDPRAVATLSTDRQPFSKAHTRRTLQAWSDHWTVNGFGVWVFHKMDGDFVGYAGLKQTSVQDRREVELLYALRPEFWGQRYATEMSRAALRFGFEQADLREVVAYTLPTNEASRRVMEKCGFRFEREIEHAGLPHVLYRIRADSSRKTH